MNSKRIKRILSVALSLSMVLSTNLTGFAAGADLPEEQEAAAAEGAGSQIEGLADTAGDSENPPECAEDAHDWEILKVISEATCSQKGAYQVKCKICSKEDYISTPRTGHTYELEGFVEVTQEEIDAGTAPEGAVANTVITKQATCSEAGEKKYICGTCQEGAAGHESAPVAIETLPHTWEDTERHADATCTENGYFYTKCQNCDAQKDKRDDPDAPKLYHTYEEGAGDAYDPEASIAEKIDGDCTQEHEVTYTCQRAGCGHSETGTIRHEAHADGADVTVPATCDYPAMTYTPCTRKGCTVRRNTQVVPDSQKLYHTYEKEAADYDLAGSTTKDVPATCEEAGETVYTCKRAGCTEENSENHTKTVTHDPLGHDYTSEKSTSEVTKEPTCLEEGIRTIHCGNAPTDPAHDKTEPIPVAEHKWTDVPKKDATCGEDGLEAYTWCPVCKAYKDGAEPKVIPADPTKHVYNGAPIVYKPATCTETGLGKYVCTVCGKSSIFGTIPAMHAYQMLDKDGNVVVNEEFAGDADSGSTVTGTEAGCLTKGYKTFTCGKCDPGTPGKTYSLTINALGHDYDAGVVTTEPTCADKGVKTFTCQRNGCTALTKGHSYTEEVEPTGKHTFVQGTVPATCSEPQKIGSACSVCHAEDPDNPPAVDVDASGNPKVPALGHTYEDAKYQTAEGEIDDAAYQADYPEYFSKVGATCADGGRAETKTYTCAREGCTGEGHTKVVAGEVPEHQLDPMYENATCQHAGYSYEKCSVCGEETDPTYHPDTDPQKDHNYVLQTALRPATCTVNGIGQYKCSMCQDVKNQVIPAHHAYEGEDHQLLTGDALQAMVDAGRVSVVIKTPATCAAAGEATYTCLDCPDGTAGKETKVTLAKLTHIYGAPQWKSEIEGGVHYDCVDDVEIQTCTQDNCTDEMEGHTIETPVEATAEHDTAGVQETVQPATCTTPKQMVKICKTCGQAAEARDAAEADGGAQAALGHTYERADVLTEGKLDEDKYKAAYPNYYSRTEASCEGEGTKGKIVYTCAQAGCEGEGHTLEVELAVPEHVWEPKFVEASCQGNAQSYEKCAVCGKETEKTDMGSMGPEYQQKDHDYQFVEAFREATCTQNGLGKYQCPMCKAVKNEVTPAHHAYEDEQHRVLSGDALQEMVDAKKVSVKVNTAASCTAAGEAVYTCLVCEENTAGKAKTVELPQLVHRYDETKFTWKSVKNGGAHYDCQDDVKIFACQQPGCTHTKEEAAPATDVHDIAGVSATVVEATCTLPKREVKICKVCGGEAERNVVQGDGAVPALGHAFQKMENGEPVLDEDGNIVLVDDVDNNPLVKAEGDLPTCTQGSERTYTCKRCEASPEEGCSITVNVPATGHDKEEKYIAATCEEPGKIIKTCKHDATERFPEEDQILKDAQGNILDPALGHVEEAVAEVKSTCKTKGHTAGVRCTRCKKTLSGNTELPLNSENHEWEEALDSEENKEPNCETGEDGYMVYECYHEDTGETFTKGETIKAEHHYGDERISDDGMYIIHTCTVCGHTENLKLMYGYVECTNEDCISYGKIVVADEIPRKAPTCTADGAAKGLACPDCGTVFEGCEKIDKIPHTLSWVTKQEATCGKAGSEIQHCSMCDQDIGEARPIPATNLHTYEATVQDPDCEHPFRLSYVCKTCGQEDPQRPTEEIGAPLGHHFVDGVCTNGCGKAQVEAKTSMSAFVDTKNKVRITAITKVNDKQLKVVEMGLLYATDGNVHTEDDIKWYEGASVNPVKKKVLGDATKDGVYMDIGVGSLVTRELYGRAYVVTEDEDGKQSIVYGDLLKGTFQGLYVP